MPRRRLDDGQAIDRSGHDAGHQRRLAVDRHDLARADRGGQEQRLAEAERDATSPP